MTNVYTNVRVESRALKEAVFCLTEAKNKHSRLLIGADISGKIAFWNLTLFAMNPTELHIDYVVPGYHNREDSAIMSLAFHWKTQTLFSGGADRNIMYWKPQGGERPVALEKHAETICFLDISENYLVSGDESGEIVLWIVKIDSIRNSVESVTRLCRWPVNDFGSSRALSQLFQVNFRSFLQYYNMRDCVDKTRTTVCCTRQRHWQDSYLGNSDGEEV